MTSCLRTRPAPGWADVRPGGEPVGRWGLAVLVVTGVAGLVLAIHGWSGRGAGVAPSLAGGRLGAVSAAPGETVPSSPSARAATSPAAGPTPSATTSPGASGSSSPAPGPLLRSEPFASVAYRIWPGPVSATASQALTGLSISVHKRVGGLDVTASARGQGAAATHLYQGGVRVYVVEASLGDDSGNSDYSLGDDGVVVTDSQGRIIQ
jgi:hypothetical protein